MRSALLAVLIALSGCQGSCSQVGSVAIGDGSATLPIGQVPIGRREFGGAAWPADAWMDFDVATLSAVGDGNPISTWTDGGSKGVDATAAGVARPTYRAGGGSPYVDCDGSDDDMTTSSFTVEAQPFTICIVGYYENSTPSAQYIVDGFSASNRHIVGYSKTFCTSAPNQCMHGGTALYHNSNAITKGAYVHWAAYFAGASSTFCENGSCAVPSSNPGTHGTVGMGICNANFGGRIKRIVMAPGDTTAACWAAAQAEYGL